jgi:hypothetical protein
MQIAYLFLGYRAPRILAASAQILNDDDDLFLLHVDKKLDLKNYMQEMNAPHVHPIAERFEINWGTFSMVEAEVALLRAALAASSPDYFVFLSDDCIPIKSKAFIRAGILEGSYGMPCTPVSRMAAGFLERYSDFHYCGNFGFDRLTRPFYRENREDLVKLLYLLDRGKATVDLHHASQWCCLSREDVARILDVYDNNDHVYLSFRFSKIPDEHFFPTIIKRHKGERNKQIMYTEWPRSNEFKGPRVFDSIEQLDSGLQSDRLFMRKIKPDASFLVDYIADNIAG